MASTEPRRESRKPTRPLTSIVFPKEGDVYALVEELPETKKQIERLVVQRFLAALAEQGTVLDAPMDGDPWPDFLTRDGAGPIGIEVAEVVIREHAMLAERQRRYADRVCELLLDVLPRMNGLHIQLDDGYQDPPYPGIASKAGQRLANDIAEYIRGSVDQLETLPIGQGIVLSWCQEAARPKVGAICHRVASSDEPSRPAVFRFFGSFPVLVDRARAQLTETVIGKLDKHYDRSAGRLWLLTYGSFVVPMVHDAESLDQAAVALAARDVRPFDEIWYVDLIPGPGRSRAVRLRPSGSAIVRARR